MMLWTEYKKNINISIETLFPDYLEVEKMVYENGINLMYNSISNRKLCCEIRKIHPLRRISRELWMLG